MGRFAPALPMLAAAALSMGLGGASAPKKPAPKAAAAAKPSAAKPSAAKAGGPEKPTAATPAAPSPSLIVYVIRRTEDAWTVIDPAAIERLPDGAVRRANIVTVRRNLLNGGPPQPGYVRTLNEFDCVAQRFRWRTFTIFNRFGAMVVKQDNPDPAFVALDRGSEEESAFRTVCDGAGGGSVVAAPSLGQLVVGLMQAWDEAAMALPLNQIRPDATAPADPKAKPPATPGPKPATKPQRGTPSA